MILKAYKGDITQLRKSEQFLLEMMKIDRYEERLKAILFANAFQERKRDLETVIELY